MSEPKESMDKANLIVTVETNEIADSQEPTTENEKSVAIWSSGSSWDDICNGSLALSIVEIVQICTPLPQRTGGRMRVSGAQSKETSKASSIPIIAPKTRMHKLNKSIETRSEPSSPARIPKYVNSKIPIISTPEINASISSRSPPVKTRSSSLGAIPKKTPYSVTKAIPKKTSTLKKSASTLFSSTPNKINGPRNGAIQKVHSSLNGTVPKKTGVIPKENVIVPKETRSVPKKTESVPKEIGTTLKNTGTISKEKTICDMSNGAIQKVHSSVTEDASKKTETILKNTGTIPKDKKICGIPNGEIQKVNSSVTEIMPKNTGTIPEQKKICSTPNGAIQKVGASVTEDAPKMVVEENKETILPTEQFQHLESTSCRHSEAEDSSKLFCQEIISPSEIQESVPVSKLDKIEEKLDDSATSKVGVQEDYVKIDIEITSQFSDSRSLASRQWDSILSRASFGEETYTGQTVQDNDTSQLSDSRTLSARQWDSILSRASFGEETYTGQTVQDNDTSQLSDSRTLSARQWDSILSRVCFGEETRIGQAEEEKDTSQLSDSRNLASRQWDSILSSASIGEDTHIGQIEEEKYISQLSDSRSMSSGQWDSTLSSETMVEETDTTRKEQTSSKENKQDDNMLKLRTKPINLNDPPVILKPKKSSYRKWFRSKLPKPTPEFRQIVEAQTDVEDVIRLVDLTVEELLKINALPEYGKIEGLKRNVRFTEIMDSYNREYARSDVQDSDFGTMDTETVISEARTEATSDITVDCSSYMTTDSGQDTMDTFSEMRVDNPDDWEDIVDENSGENWEVVKTKGLSTQKLRDICNYIRSGSDKDVDSTVTIEACPQQDNYEELAIKDKHLPRDKKYDKLNINAPEHLSNEFPIVNLTLDETIIDQTSTDQQLLDGQNLEQQLHDLIDEDEEPKLVTDYQKSSTSKIEPPSFVSEYQRPPASKLAQSRLVSEYLKPSGSKAKPSKFAANYQKSTTAKVDQPRLVTDYQLSPSKFIPYSHIPSTTKVDQQKIDYQIPSTSKVQEDMICADTTVRGEIQSVPLKPKRKVSFDTAVLKIDAPVFKPLMFPNYNESTASTSSTNGARPESSQTSSTSSLQSWSTGEYPHLYSITSEDKLRKMKEIIALSAFKNYEPCNTLEGIRPDLVREKTSRAAELKELIREKKADDRDGTTKTFQIEGQTITVNTPPARKVHAHNPESRNILETIERIEDFLELVLTLGFKISRSMIDKFERQQVPTPIHNAMCDVRSFTSPIKQQLRIALEFGDGVFFKPLADSVNATINPAFNHLNDSVIALESPATLNFIPLKSEPVRRATNFWDQDPFSTLQNFEAQPHLSNDFMTHTMNQFFKLNRFRMMSPMERGRINPKGLVEIPFQHDIQVGVTIDLGLMLMSRGNKVLIALSADEVLAGMRFRYGEVFQKNELIEFSCFNGFNEVMKRARFNEKGVSFQDEMSPLTYLITPAGISTCQPIISCIVPESITNIFYSGSRVGEQFTPECVELLQFSRFEFHQDDSMNWIIKNVKIKQTTDGQVVIHKKNATYTLVITPRIHEGNEFAVSSRLTTPTIHVTSSAQIRDKGNKFHMYARKQGKKIFYSEQKFVCRNNTQSAGIDANHLIYLDAD